MILVAWLALLAPDARAQTPTETPPTETPPTETPPPPTPPTLLHEQTPLYPDEARARRIRGDVVVRLQLDEAGAVVQVDLVHPVHPLLDLPAMEAARALRFAPATRDGVPVPSSVDYRFHFDYAVVDEREGATNAGTLFGQVEDLDGIPIPAATVTLTLISPAGAGPGVDAEPRAVEVGDDGKFTASFLAPGRWEVRVETTFAPPAVFSLDVGQGETVQSAFPVVDANEIVVYGQRATWREVARGELLPNETSVTGSYTLTRRDIEATPGSLEDAARAVQALPGVVGDPDLLANFNVRGGESGDVVFLLDRVPLDNPFHLAGFNSLFNPDMLKEIQFYAGAPPADVPAGTSAVMAVDSWDGAPRTDAHDLDGAIDISASSARALVMGPLTRDESLTVALAARRTYLEGYFQVMKWLNVVDTAFAAPEYSELSARLAWRPGRHRLMLTAMRSGDSLALVDSGDASLVNFDGRFELRNALHLFAADHTFTASDTATWRTTAALTIDRSFLARDLGGVTARTYRTWRGYARTDLDATVDGDLRVQIGADAAVTRLLAEGEIEDPRVVPQWANTGIVDLGQPLVELGEIAAYPELSAYGQGVALLDPAQVRSGVRVRYAGATDEWLVSPSGGVSFPLPTGTIPKLAFAWTHRAPRDPIVLDPELGNPDIGSEHAAQLVVGVDQGFPLPGNEAGGLLRVEAYVIRRTGLVVRPDVYDPHRQAPTFTNAGTGHDRGVDALIGARAGRLSGMMTYGYLVSDRLNPLGTTFGTEIAPPQDQRHTYGVSAEWQLTARWRTTARYTFHTGRPVSRLVAGGDDFAALTCLNCDRLGPTHDIAVRAEWRRAYDRFLLSIYFEVLNAVNFRSPFTPIANVEGGVLESSMLYHLPVRPFLGIRADF